MKKKTKTLCIGIIAIVCLAVIVIWFKAVRTDYSTASYYYEVTGETNGTRSVETESYVPTEKEE